MFMRQNPPINDIKHHDNLVLFSNQYIYIYYFCKKTFYIPDVNFKIYEMFFIYIFAVFY